MKEIILNQGKIAIVDEEDYARINKYKWCTGKSGNTFYAHRNAWNGKNNWVSMHREILCLAKYDGKMIDHINRNGLDNRKANLRLVNKEINACNSKIQQNNTSGFRGVSWHKQCKVWRTNICIKGNVIFCGCYPDKTSAALAYDRAAIKYRGKNAVLNFPKEVK